MGARITEKGKQPDAVTWLKHHPEDIPMARENLRARDRGFDDDNVRQLMAIICLKACADYKSATSLTTKKKPEDRKKMIDDCHRFFESDMFQYFVNGMSVDEIEKDIRATPEDAIKAIWYRMENRQAEKEIG